MSEDIFVSQDIELNNDNQITSEKASPSIKKNYEKESKLVQLPLSKIKTIMKLDPDVSVVSKEALIIVTKATELFIERLTREMYEYTAKNKRKTIQKRDLEAVIESTDALCFLEGTLND